MYACLTASGHAPNETTNGRAASQIWIRVSLSSWKLWKQHRVWQWIKGFTVRVPFSFLQRSLYIHRSPTTRLMRLCDVTGSITFSFSRPFQWWTCYSMSNAPRCRGVDIEPTRGCQALRPSLWNLLLFVCSERFKQVACWTLLCRALAMLTLFLNTQRNR